MYENIALLAIIVLVYSAAAGNLVSVYRSLGGGWEIRSGRDPVELLPAETRDELRERTRLWRRALP